MKDFLKRSMNKYKVLVVDDELLSDPRCADVEFGHGVVTHITGDKPVESWFESAKNAAMA